MARVAIQAALTVPHNVEQERARCVAIVTAEYEKWASEPNGSLPGASYVRMTLGAIGNMIEEGEPAPDSLEEGD